MIYAKVEKSYLVFCLLISLHQFYIGCLHLWYVVNLGLDVWRLVWAGIRDRVCVCVCVFVCVCVCVYYGE